MNCALQDIKVKKGVTYAVTYTLACSVLPILAQGHIVYDVSFIYYF